MNTININYRAEKLHHKVHRHARRHVHRLRGESDTHKKIFAFSFAFVVTLVVFMLWYFLSLPKILDTYRVTKAENQRLNDSPIDKFKNILKGKDGETDPNINNIEVIQ
jgi:hypothetical protein